MRSFKMKTKTLKLMLVCLMMVAMIGLSMPQQAQAAEIDILVRKLVEKGVLSPGDAQQILNETKEEAKMQLAKGEAPGVPQWVQNVKVKGDLRTRYQWQKQDTGTATKANDRDRTRIRLRLGMDAKVNDQVNIAAGLSTGGTDPRSTNQTLENFFQTPDIRLEYAYARYMPFSWMTLSGGKVKNPLWKPSSLLWDGDIYPDGASMNLAWSAYPKFDTFLNTGFFVLDESSGYNADPIMWAIQPGFKWGMTDQADLKATFNYYGFNGLKGKVGENRSSPATNSTDGSGRYIYRYDSIGASAELGFKKPFGDEGIFTNLPYMGVFGDFIHNPDPANNKNGWLIGGKFGYSSVKSPGEWQGVYNYRKLQKDAWLDVFPDSDFYGGATDVKGHEIKLHYGLLKNVNLTMGYFNSERLSGDKRKEDLFQADLVFKF
jgi:polyhydroxyalkanoate synthesis regulator phasin